MWMTFGRSILALVVLLAVGVGFVADYGWTAEHVRQNSGDAWAGILGEISSEVDIDGDRVPDKISLIKSKKGDGYDLVAVLSKFRKQILLSFIRERDKDHVHVSFIRKSGLEKYIRNNRLVSERDRRRIEESSASNFLDVNYDEASGYVILIGARGGAREIFYAD